MFLSCTSQGNNIHPYPYHFPLFPCDNLYISVQLFLHSLLIFCTLLSCIYLKYFSFDVIHQSTFCLLLVLLFGICRISLSDWLYTYLGGILKTRTVTVVERHCWICVKFNKWHNRQHCTAFLCVFFLWAFYFWFLLLCVI